MDKKEVINREETVPVCINPVSDILDCLPNKNDTVSPKNSPLANEKSESCYICSTDHEIIELIDCSICSTKGNNNCNLYIYFFLYNYYNYFIITL